MKFGWRLWLIAALACAPGMAGATLVNGLFDDGLNGWVTSGDVEDGGGYAESGDDDVDSSRLYQIAAYAAGQYRIEFDFLNGLSDFLPTGPFAFPDTVFASLYFIDDGSAFDLDALTYDDALSLFDATSEGQLTYNGTIGASSLGGGWLHFSLDFTNTYANLIPTFELFNLNGEYDDSLFDVDNVVITALDQEPVIPEPATLSLLAIGLGCAGVLRRRRS